MSDNEPEMTQRERRRQQHTPERSSPIGGGNAKKLLMPAIIIGLLGLVVGMMYLTATGGDDCPGHWHSTFEVYVDGDKVSFQDFNLENGRTPLSSHLHRGNDAQWHFEPNPARCIDFSEALSFVGMDLENGRLELDGSVHQANGVAGVYKDDGNKTLQVYRAIGNGEWEQISAKSAAGKQRPDGERMLILYGTYSPEEIAALQDGVPFPSGVTPDTHPGM